MESMDGKWVTLLRHGTAWKEANCLMIIDLTLIGMYLVLTRSSHYESFKAFKIYRNAKQAFNILLKTKPVSLF